MVARLEVFVPGKPENPLNGSLAHAHWTKRARWARTRREAACMAILAALGRRSVRWLATTPKRVTFTVVNGRAFDDDNLRAVCKAWRDSLKDMRLIDDDRPSAGHEFIYRQDIRRGRPADYGVRITVEVL